jgi:hypothetical protein
LSAILIFLIFLFLTAGIAIYLLPPKALNSSEWVLLQGFIPDRLTLAKVFTKRRISRADNRYLRSDLYMPALSAKQHDPHVKVYFQHLIYNNKTPLQAVCAIMRLYYMQSTAC